MVIVSEKGEGKGGKRAFQSSQMEINRLSALTPRLLNRWRSRRQRVCEPPRSKRGSRTRANRVHQRDEALVNSCLMCSLLRASNYFSHLLAPRADVCQEWFFLSVFVSQHVAIVEFAFGRFFLRWMQRRKVAPPHEGQGTNLSRLKSSTSANW